MRLPLTCAASPQCCHGTARRVRVFSEDSWAARQVARPALASVASRTARGGRSPTRRCVRATVALGVASRRPTGPKMQGWPLRRGDDPDAGVVILAALHPLLVAEIRYPLWTHPKSAAPAKISIRWVRRLVSPAGRMACSHCSSLIRATGRTYPRDNNCRSRPRGPRRLGVAFPRLPRGHCKCRPRPVTLFAAARPATYSGRVSA